MRHSKQFIVAVMAVVATRAAPAFAGQTVIDDFDTDLEAGALPSGWVFEGATDAAASGSLVVGPGRTGQGALLGFNFYGHDGSAAYVSMTRTLPTPVTAAAIGYWEETVGGIYTALRVKDSSGQVLQYSPNRPFEDFDGSAWFEQVVDLAAPSSHEGGKNDGVVHQPIQAVSLVLVNPGGGGQGGNVGSVSFDDLVAFDSLAVTLDPTAALSCLTYIDDTKQRTADDGPFYGVANSVPSDLVARHLPGQLPWAFDAGAVWVTDVTPPADPTGFTDSTAQIQAAIEAAHQNGGDEVFVPRGDYSISGTLTLYPNTKFFGVPGDLSRFQGFGWVTHHTLQPFVAVGDAAHDPAGARAGRAIVSDIGIGLPSDATSYAPYAKLLPDGGANYDPTDQTYLYAIEWQTGRSSVANQISIGYQGPGNVTTTSPPPMGDVLVVPATRNVVQLDHEGGGRWYGLQVAGGGFNSATGNTFSAAGTSAALSIYGSNIEHATGRAFYELSQASNVRVLGSKTESGSAPYWFSIDSSTNVLLSGLTTHENSEVIVHDPTDVSLDTLAFYSVEPAQGAGLAFVADDKASYSFLNTYDLFKWGSFDNTAFPHCGDHVCDGGETIQSCAADCTACP